MAHLTTTLNLNKNLIEVPESQKKDVMSFLNTVGNITNEEYLSGSIINAWGTANFNALTLNQIQMALNLKLAAEGENAILSFTTRVNKKLKCFGFEFRTSIKRIVDVHKVKPDFKGVNFDIDFSEERRQLVNSIANDIAYCMISGRRESLQNVYQFMRNNCPGKENLHCLVRQVNAVIKAPYGIELLLNLSKAIALNDSAYNLVVGVIPERQSLVNKLVGQIKESLLSNDGKLTKQTKLDLDAVYSLLDEIYCKSGLFPNAVNFLTYQINGMLDEQNNKFKLQPQKLK
jgi:hypothetical protein